MKKLLSIIAILLAVFVLFGCAANTEEENEVKENVRVLCLKGPTGIGMTKLMDDNDAGTTKNNYEISILAKPDEVSAEVIAGRFDIACVSTNQASILYKKTNGAVKVLCLNTLGVLYILENGNTINSISDLKGKTIGATGQGAVPEYALNYLLESNGIDPEKDVNIVYYSEHSELVTLLVSGEVDIGMLPEPNVTTALSKNENLRTAINLTEEWDKLDNGTLTQGAVIVSTTFLEEHEDAVKKFMEEYKESIAYATSNLEETAEASSRRGIIPSRDIARNAIPNTNTCYIDGEEMKEKLSAFLEVLYNYNPSSVGGELPDEEFYYMEGKK